MVRSCRQVMISSVIVLTVAGTAVWAADVKVTVTFDAGTGMTDADKTAVIAAMQKKYDDAGLTDVKLSTAAGGALTLNFEATAPAKKFGDSNKKGKNARELAKFSATDLMTFDTAEKRRNVWAESGAHEVAHLLCAVHNLDDPASLMTKGNKVTDAKRAADGRAFTGADVAAIKMGIKMLQDGKSWDLDAKFDDRTDFWSIPGVNNTGLRNDNSIVSFTVMTTDPSWSFGFLNEFGEYVERVPAGTSLGYSEFGPGEFGNFAVEKIGQVVPFDRMTGLVVPSLLHTPGDADLSEFANSGQLMNYYSRLDLNFGLPGLPLLTIDASTFSTTDGFALAVPEPTTCWLVLAAIGLCTPARRRKS